MKQLLSLFFVLVSCASFAQTNGVVFNDNGQAAIAPLIPAPSATKASLVIPTGTAPTSPADGSVWYDNTQKCMVAYINGMMQTLAGDIYSNQATKYLDNPTTNTSLFPTTFWGSRTLPANFLTAGKGLRIRFKNVYSSNTLTNGATIIVSVGGVTVASSVLGALANNVTNLSAAGEITILCTATGTSGSVVCGGGIDFTTGALGKAFGDLSNGGVATTINTTINNTIDVTARFNSNQTNQNITILVSNIQVIK